MSSIPPESRFHFSVLRLGGESAPSPQSSPFPLFCWASLVLIQLSFIPSIQPLSDTPPHPFLPPAMNNNNNIRDAGRCSICQEPLDTELPVAPNPLGKSRVPLVLTSCGHTLCASENGVALPRLALPCLWSHYFYFSTTACSERSLKNGGIACPQCREVTPVANGIQDLKPNFALMQLVADLTGKNNMKRASLPIFDPKTGPKEQEQKKHN